MAEETAPTKSIADAAVELGFITQVQADEAHETKRKLGELGVPEELHNILLKKGWLTADQVSACRRALGEKKVIAGFEIISHVGKGGMGTVYKARQLTMDRIVALKILPPTLAKDPVFKERFIREARASGRLDHLNIVHGIDVGEDKGITYFAMEFVDGPTCKRVLKTKGRLPWEEAVGISAQICAALDYAWKQGVVHRDVKPDNIMLTPDGVAKLCDLGLAKEFNQEGDSGLTQSGQAVGTPHYISPEQAKGRKDIDTRSDIYSLGASLYHMACGKVPFEAPNSTAVMVMHVTDVAPSPRHHEPSLSPLLELIIAKAMSKDPADRYQTPGEFRADLEWISEGEVPLLAATFHGKSSITYDLYKGELPERAEMDELIARRTRRGTTGPLEPIRPRGDRTGKTTGPQEAVRPRGHKTTGPQEAVKPRLGKASHESSSEVRHAPSAPSEGLPGLNEPSVKLPAAMAGAALAEPKRDLQESIPTDKLAPVKPRLDKDGSGRHADALVLKPKAKPAPEEKVATAPVTPMSAHTPSAPPAPREEPAAKQGSPLLWVLVGGIVVAVGIFAGLKLTSGDKTDQSQTPPAPSHQVPPPPPPQVVTPPPAVFPPPPTLPPIAPITPKPPKVTERPPEPPPLDPIAVDPIKIKPPEHPNDPPPPDLEKEAFLAFDKVSRGFKDGKPAGLKEALDEIQEKYAKTNWYLSNSDIVEAAYQRLTLGGKPWDAFLGLAKPLDGEDKDRWLLITDQITYQPYERFDWLLLPGTKLNWRAGAVALTAAGGTPSGMVCGQPVFAPEKLEATVMPEPGADFGWAVFADGRQVVPLATCWYEPDGTIHFWANEVEKTLKLKYDPKGGARHLAVQFKGQKAWIESGGQKEEVDLPASPGGSYVPGLVVNKGAMGVGVIRVYAQLPPNYLATIEAENARVKTLKGKSLPGALTIWVVSEHPARVLIGNKFAQPDVPAGFKPVKYVFNNVAGGMPISVRQYPPQGKGAGPVLLELVNGEKRTATGLSPNYFFLPDDLNQPYYSWMTEPSLFGPWQQASAELAGNEVQSKVPPDFKGKFVLTRNKGLIMRYVLDPADFK